MTDTIVLWEAPPTVEVERRLYYDDSGRPLFYSCEKPEGNYIVVDTLTYAQGRLDFRIVDGRISTVPSLSAARLFPGNSGTPCAMEDVNIVVGPDYSGEVINWEMRVYEL